MSYLEINREAWNKRTRIHIKSKFYDVNGFMGGSSSLREIELAELNNVENKSLLHLQCHFGLDTLSWARMGAIVTGVDLSTESIEQAKKISRKANIDSTFICGDLYDFEIPGASKKFDIVYTSYGAICWLPCLDKRAKKIAECLKPGGMFYMVEFHPVIDFLAGEQYFHSSKPFISKEKTYTDGDTGEVSEIYTWSHSLSDVVNSLINEGVIIKYLNEYPFSPYNCFDGLVEKETGRYYKSLNEQQAPLVYSVCAIKST